MALQIGRVGHIYLQDVAHSAVHRGEGEKVHAVLSSIAKIPASSDWKNAIKLSNRVVQLESAIRKMGIADVSKIKDVKKAVRNAHLKLEHAKSVLERERKKIPEDSVRKQLEETQSYLLRSLEAYKTILGGTDDNEIELKTQNRDLIKGTMEIQKKESDNVNKELTKIWEQEVLVIRLGKIVQKKEAKLLTILETAKRVFNITKDYSDDIELYNVTYKMTDKIIEHQNRSVKELIDSLDDSYAFFQVTNESLFEKIFDHHDYRYIFDGAGKKIYILPQKDIKQIEDTLNAKALSSRQAVQVVQDASTMKQAKIKEAKATRSKEIIQIHPEIKAKGKVEEGSMLSLALVIAYYFAKILVLYIVGGSIALALSPIIGISYLMYRNIERIKNPDELLA